MDVVALQAANAAAKKRTIKRDKAARVLTALRSAPARGVGLGPAYPVATDLPTVVNGTADTITSSYTEVYGAELNGTRWSLLGSAPVTWNNGQGALNTSVNGLDSGLLPFGFLLTGTEVEITWRAGSSPETRWIWVDGKPITAAPEASQAGITVSSGSVYRTKLTFGAAGVRRIEYYPTTGQLIKLRVSNATSSVSSLPAKGAKLFCLGDSYLGGSSLIPALQTWGRQIGYACGFELFQGGQGGTGYIAVGQYGARALTDPSRLDPVVSADPDAVLILMGGNDANTAAATVGAAATTVFSYLAARIPNVPLIVAGTYACDATNTMATGRAAVNKAIRDAALAAPNVLGYIDPIGNADTGTVPAGLGNGTAYNVGDRYAFQGAIYRVLTAHTGGTSPDGGKTECLTWLTGTGNASSPAGNGNRDLLLSSDNTHWTLLGASVQAQRLMQGSAKLIDTYLAT